MRVEITQIGDVHVITPMEKTIDASVSPDFRAALIGQVQEGTKKLVLNLAHVEFMDSSGLGAMVSALKALGKEGNLAVCGVTEPVMSVLSLTRLDRVFRMFPDQDQACEALKE